MQNRFFGFRWLRGGFQEMKCWELVAFREFLTTGSCFTGEDYSRMFCTRHPMFTATVGVGETERFLTVFPPRIYLLQEFLRDLSPWMLDQFQLWEYACIPHPAITLLPNIFHHWYHYSSAGVAFHSLVSLQPQRWYFFLPYTNIIIHLLCVNNQ